MQIERFLPQTPGYEDRGPTNPEKGEFGMQTDVWTYRERSTLGTDLSTTDITGFEVEAIDGSIGKIDDATFEVGSSYLVVDTGPWIFGKKVMIPAGVVQRIDQADRKVFVNRTKDEIKNAPEFEASMISDDSYRGHLGSYYGPGGQAYRDWDDTV
jgi:hypothetical protein